MSGAVAATLIGTLAIAAGWGWGLLLLSFFVSSRALFIAVVAILANWPVSFAAVALGGVAGAFADSILGGTLQAQRWCDVCARSTERPVHNCGTTTRPAGGLARFDNDLINAVCSGVGALVALLLI